MPKIINTYTDSGDSLTSALTGLASSIFGGNQARQELIRQKALGTIRENENIPLAADALRRGDVDSAIFYGSMGGMQGNNVAAFNRLGTVSRAPSITDPTVSRAMLAAGDSAGSTPWGVQQTNDRQARTQIAVADRAAAQQQRQFDATFKNMQRPDGQIVPVPHSQVAARVGEGWTAPRTLDQVKAGVFTNLAAPRAAAPMSPTAVPFVDAGAPAPDGAIPAPVQQVPTALNPTQRSLLGLPTTPRNYVANGQNHITYEGATDVNGNPLPGGGHIANAQGSASDVGLRPNVAGGLQTSILNAQQAEGLATGILNLVSRDPGIVGPLGNVRRLGQNAVDVVTSVAPLFGSPDGFKAQVDAARTASPNAARLLPELFNPDLNNIQTLNGLLIYKTAEAIGQTGKGAGEGDIKRVLEIVGSPSSWVTGPSEYKNKVAQLRNIIQSTRESNERTLRGGLSAGPAPTAGAPNAAPSLQILKDKYGLQ